MKQFLVIISMFAIVTSTCVICGSHGGEDVGIILICDVVLTRKLLPEFWRNVLSPVFSHLLRDN